MLIFGGVIGKFDPVCQAKFSYDLAPVEVVVGKAERRWYDYITQIFAITGRQRLEKRHRKT